ncbi:hypothetical protein N9L06_04675 [Mariniblastus sp.]|nr:hypothetical protein [Mariniblastus sp.]
MSNRNLPFARHKKRRSGFTQPLRVESLEDRRLLATFTVTNLNDAGDGSLREAVSLANSNSGADEIVFSQGTTGTIELTSGELEVTEELTITGPTQENLTLDARHNSRVINFTASTGDLTIGELTLTNGQTREDAVDFNDTSQNGGGIRFVSAGVLTLTNSQVRDNQTLGDRAGGGGIFADVGTVNLIDSTVSFNQAVGYRAEGGGIFSETGSISLTNSQVLFNQSIRESGGGIFSSEGSISLIGSSVRDNSAAGDGGGIYSRGGSISLTASSISANRSSGNGGGIRLNVGSIEIENSSIVDNAAGRYGGGIFVFSGSATIASSYIDRNSAESDGGGIYARSTDLNLSQSSLNDNRASGSGGGIDINRGSVTLDRSDLNGNHASEFGGGIWSNNVDIDVVDSTIDGNSALNSGGGISARGGIINITQSTLSNNLGRDGGAFDSDGGRLNLVRSTVSGNVALRNGGGLSANGRFLIDGSTIVDNTAIEAGGGFATDFSFISTIRNSIIADNSDNGTAPDVDLPEGLVVSHSLIGNNAGSGLLAAPVGSPDADGNLVGTSDSPIDPLLGELAFNGGPTETHLLLPGSPAIDAGDEQIQSTSDDFSPDQRGLGAVIDGDGDGTRTLDIGAVELSLASPVAFSFVRDASSIVARPDLLGSISVSFDVNVRIDADDLVIRNDTLGGVLVDTSGLSVSNSFSDQTATWDFSNLTLEPGFYSFQLSDSITSFAGGVSLDGDFDGTPGGNFVESIYVALPGDANMDGQVDVLGDAFPLVANLGITNGGATWAQGDFNGDGFVDVLNDAFTLVANLGRSLILPATSPPSATSKLTVAASNATDPLPSLERVVLVSGIETINPKEQQADQKAEKLLASSTPAALAGSVELDAAFEVNGLFEDSLF